MFTALPRSLGCLWLQKYKDSIVLSSVNNKKTKSLTLGMRLSVNLSVVGWLIAWLGSSSSVGSDQP